MGNWPGRPTPETRKRLDVAINDIMIWVCDNLPDGWEIALTMSGGEDGEGEAQLALINPEGEEVSGEWDGDSLNVWTMVDYANNPDDPRALGRDDDDA